MAEHNGIAERLQLIAELLTSGEGQTVEISYADILEGAAAIKRLRESLILAEDVLSRAPFSTGIWPNGMHPQRGMQQIRDTITSVSGAKEP
jgi:hypothetical protein